MRSIILVRSLWRVFLIILCSQLDMPSLDDVYLNREWAFYCRKTHHTKSSSSSSHSLLDITPALSDYLRFTVSFTYNLHVCQLQSSPLYYSLSHQINIPTVHSISIALIAIEMSHSSQLHISISSTSNSINKPPVTKQATTRAKTPTSHVNRHSLPLSLNGMLYQKKTIHTNNTLLFTPHPSITPPIPIPPFPIPTSTPPSSPTQITHFPTINNNSPTEHPNPHHSSLPLHLPSTNSPFPPTTLGVPNLASTPPSPISTQGVSTGTGIIAFFKVRTGFLLSNPIPFPCTLAHLSVDTP